MATELTARDILSPEYIGVSESDVVRDAVRLMREERSECVLVLRGAEVLGIMTEWDVLGLVETGDDPGATPVEDVMSRPVITITDDRPVSDAAELMARENVRTLVVEDGEDIAGLVTQRDVITVAGSYGATTAPATAMEAAPAEDPSTGGEGFASGQGVCEICGSLAETIWETNGKLVCGDCRGV